MEVISTRRYEARPPATIHSGLLYDPNSAIAKVKEEEWETRKKKEITTTRQIETRVKRQVVLEDGAVVQDSGPLVTTNTTEDVEQQEHTTQERRTNGDEPKEVEWSGGGGALVQKELNETIVRSREETEELLETEDRRQFGDITDEAYQQAVRNNRGDLRVALAESAKQVAVKPGPRVVQHKTKSQKVIDTEKTLERKELTRDGAIVTETKKSVEHEEIRDNELPEDDHRAKNGPTETRKEGSQRFLKQRDEDVVDYVSGGERIAREMRYVSEKTEAERVGDWPPPPDTMRTVRLPKPGESSPLDRKDALTKKPLDPEDEDEARKFETSKWLENHFGSESRSSQGSIEPDAPIQTSTNTSFINVTMKSCTPRDREYKTTSNSSQRRTTGRASGRESASPSGYFHGITEWSERYQGSGEKDKSGSMRTSSPKHYVMETRETTRSSRQIPETVTYTRNYETSTRRHHETRRSSPPSPPVRRRVREQMSRREEKTSYADGRPPGSPSPVNVVQRTWQSRNQDWPIEERSERVETRRYSPAPKSRSPSPVVKIPPNREKRESERTERRSQSPRGKSKIGESFRKLVGKLRSASSERKKKGGSNSTSQLTQTDDNSTYLQYNVIDKNIPEIIHDNGDHSDDRPPERPPRSPRVTSSPTTQTIKVTRSNGHSLAPNDAHNGSTHRYYHYDREPQDSRHNRVNSRYHERVQKTRNTSDYDYSVESSTLGRLSKSTSRLTNDHDRDTYYPSIQTLPRKLHSNGHSTTVQTSRRATPKQTPAPPSRSSQSRHYGSMINISIKNAVTSQSPQATQNSHTYTSPVQSTIQAPVKPERTYRSSLSRSRSFNVEGTNGTDDYPETPYKSNNQINRLDETQPLKSPGILASISRSNRDLFKHEYY